MRGPVIAVLAAVAGAAALPASAAAHAVVSMPRGMIVYSANDATSESTVTVTMTDAKVRITDTTIAGGIDPGPCDPGAVDRQGYITEVQCPRGGVTEVRIDVGARDDSVEVREAAGAAPIGTRITGGSGSDRLTGGGGADRIDAGPGPDTLDGGAGDDELLARNGTIEVPVRCGAGSDRAFLDVADVTEACESVEHGDGPPAEEPDQAPPPDETPPDIDGDARPRQHFGRSGRVVAIASVSEVAQVAATARVSTGGRWLRLTARPVRAEVPGERFQLKLRPSKSTARVLRAALRQGRRLYATVTIVATDDTGNRLALKLPRIRLAR